MKKETDPVRRRLDGILAEIGAKQNAIGFMERALAHEIEKLEAQWAPAIRSAGEELQQLEAELIGLAKYGKAELFDGTDRVDLENGALLRQVERRVRRIKGMLAALKRTGRLEAVKVVESVDWDRVEKMDDAALAELGTRRAAREIFAYEVKGAA